MFGGICRLFLAPKRKRQSGGELEGGGAVVCGFFCLGWWLVAGNGEGDGEGGDGTYGAEGGEGVVGVFG